MAEESSKLYKKVDQKNKEIQWLRLELDHALRDRKFLEGQVNKLMKENRELEHMLKQKIDIDNTFCTGMGVTEIRRNRST